jgi:glycosyltransferase involved in cell wall biosynthesis
MAASERTSIKMSAPLLSVIVPVFNGAAHIAALARDALSIEGVSAEFIAVDDGSTDDTAAILRDLAASNPRIRPVFLEANAGAGVARNHGFAQAAGRFTLFFDADDRLHGETVARAIDLMSHHGADLAMCPYRYERSADSSYDGMNVFDDRVWADIVGSRAMTAGTLNDFPGLLGFSNYPWNKVLRTETYRRAGLRFGRTKVNNDILGHWGALLQADGIVLLNEVICTHVVHPAGSNLTNQHGRVRLQLFEALNETCDLLEANEIHRFRYSHHFWSFGLRVLGWARPRIPSELLPEFRALERDFLQRVRIADFAGMLLKRDPSTAQALVQSLMI